MSEHPEGLRNRVFCASCGGMAQRRQGLPPIGWQELLAKDDAPIALCPGCVRRKLWMIEARLDLDPRADL